MLNVMNYTNADQPCKFYFEKGWPQLIIRVVHRIAKQCGPIAVIPDTGCRAVVVEPNSDVDRIIATLEHITG